VTADDYNVVRADAKLQGQKIYDRFVGTPFLWRCHHLDLQGITPNEPTIWSRDDPGTTFTLSRPIVPVACGGSNPFRLSSP
jgi:hypothetical protein